MFNVADGMTPFSLYGGARADTNGQNSWQKTRQCAFKVRFLLRRGIFA